MKINLSQLSRTLEGELAPVYMVHGDEPLQVGEAVEQIRKMVTNRGLDERLMFDAGTGFDWSSLPAEAGSLSLFGGGRLLELQLPTGKPGIEGGKVLRSMLADPVAGVVLLIRSGRLDGKAYKSAWMKAIEQAGVVLQIYPPKAAELPDWVTDRARQAGVGLSPEAAALLAENSEGNLLACAQELEKLALLFPDQQVGVDELLQSLFDNARYNIFSLVDSALAGDARRTLHVLNALRTEGTAEALVIWVLARELRVLLPMAGRVAAGGNPASLVPANRLVQGDKARKKLVIAALHRLSEMRLMAMLRYLGRIDRVVKGEIRERRTWDELERVSLWMAGVRV